MSTECVSESQLPSSFRRKPESSKDLEVLDSGFRRNDVEKGLTC